MELYDFTNATTVPAIRKSDLEVIPFPLPPLAEQQRIVDRIESLFAKLDEALEKVQEVVGYNDNKNVVVGKIELTKKSILARAFRGELGTNDPSEEPAMELLKRIV